MLTRLLLFKPNWMHTGCSFAQFSAEPYTVCTLAYQYVFSSTCKCFYILP